MSWRRFAATDSYGVLLLLIGATIVTAALGGPVGSGLWLALQATCLLYAQLISGVRGGWLVLSTVLVLIALGIGLAAALGAVPARPWRGMIGPAVGVLLAAGAIGAILHRMLRVGTVTRRTIAGLVCAYLLVGIGYTHLYLLLNAAADGRLLAGPATRSIDFLYFSYITLTTVGYGDFVPVTDAGRMAAATEALLGQIYLVTVVALAVSRLVRPGPGSGAPDRA